MSHSWVVWVAALALAGCASSVSDGMASRGDADVPDGSMQSDAAAHAMDGATDEESDAATNDGDAATDDGGADAGDAAASCGSGDDIRTGEPCASNVRGVFAIKTVVDVWWEDDIDPAIIDAGRSHVTVYQMATMSEACDDGTIEQVELKTCGLALPPFSVWARCAAHQLAVPDTIWDAPGMPSHTTSGSVSAFELGGTLALARASALVGIDLTDAAGAWPVDLATVTCASGGGPEACFPDHDGDGNPGIPLALTRIGTSYREAGCGAGDLPVRFLPLPTDALGVPACDSPDDPACAVELYAGARAHVGAAGELAECSSNRARVAGSSQATAIDTRAVGCERNDGEDCTPGDTLFVDTMLPSYRVLAKGAAPPPSFVSNPCDCSGGCSGDSCPLDQTPSVGPRSGIVWLGEATASFDCEDVRNAADSAYPGTDI